MADCYVATKSIRAAARGYEAAVLAALGVRWDGGQRHIACPYPDHADDHPSWRWDQAKGRAFCTCLGRGSDSIFDVVMKIKGLDFEAAKIFVAEALDRGDLIRTGGGPRHHKTDAASLLDPPAGERDDALVRGYLAHRLGVPPDDVSRPSTPAVGWRALAYYDPPVRRGGRPALVGHFPCAVFGTVAADGRAHAHRIYLAPGGAGKAELGAGPDGKPRDPKKSARRVGEASTAGCAVLWGDPAVAPHLILAEGIETAAALAHAFGPEVAAGERAVAAAVSEAGVRAFRPWPATRRVTVAADRDEEKAEGDAGYRVGERAARAFSLAHHGQLKVSIALPGAPGEAIDWLDVLRRAGVGAVRAGIEAAAAFVPTPEETDGARQRATRALELADVEAAYPLPAMDLATLAHRHTEAGRVKVHVYRGKRTDPETGAEIAVWTPVATPFGVPARLRHADQADAYGLRVVVQAMDGRPRPVDFERAELARAGAAEIRARLFAAGLRVEGDGEALAVQALKAADPAHEIVVVSRPGWHRPDGLPDPVFVTPAGEVLGAPEGHRLELAMGARLAEPAQGGTPDGWREAATAAAAVAGCPHWTLGVLAGFAGPVLALTGLDSCGVSLSGLSTSGKTLAQRLAVSAWTSPKIGAGLLQSMRTTENALEILAQAAGGTVLALDEIAHADGRAVGRMIYSLAGGVGKARLTAHAAPRGRYGWQTFALLSGEHSLEEKVRRDGGQWLAGMAVRIPDVDVTGVDRTVPPATLAAVGGIARHHGHAGPAFVAGLIAEGYHRNPELLREQVLRAAGRLAGGDGDGARVRAATPFALLLVAGGLATAFDLLTGRADVGGTVAWAWERFLASSDAIALDPEAQAIAGLRTWIAERWDVTIKDVAAGGDDAEAKRVNNREAVGWYDEAAVYIPTRRIVEAAGGGLKQEQIGEALERRGLLARRHDAKRRAVRRVPRVGQVDCYALRRDEFGRCDVGGESPFTVHEGGRR